MASSIAFLFGMLFGGIVLSILYGSLILEAQEKAYRKGILIGKEQSNTKCKCDFGKCKHYLKCKKQKGELCADFEECQTYMDAYDNDEKLWNEIHNWSDE